MLDNDNIISTSVSETVEKVPRDEKDYRKCSFICFTLHSYKEQTNTYLTVKNICLLPRIHPV